MLNQIESELRQATARGKERYALLTWEAKNVPGQIVSILADLSSFGPGPSSSKPKSEFQSKIKQLGKNYFELPEECVKGRKRPNFNVLGELQKSESGELEWHQPLLAKFQLASVVSTFTPVETDGSFIGVCEGGDHDGSDRYLKLTPERNYYVCGVCGAKGGILNYLCYSQKMHHADAIVFLAERACIF